MTRLILHIGPLRMAGGEPGPTVFFLSPGNPAHPVALANSLAGAERELRQMAQGDDIACEDALAAEGARLEIPTAPLDRGARGLLAAMALDIADRETFSRVNRDELIGFFCEAAAAFQERIRAGSSPDLRRFDVCVANERRAGMVIDGPGLVILDARKEPEQPTCAEDAPQIADGIGAVFASGEVAIEDALRRAFDLESLPQPFRVRAMQKFPVEDEELALLIATLFAIAGFDPEHGGTSSGHVATEDLVIEASVTKRD